MKYAFGVPAWLGAIKVSLVAFGIPAAVAGFGAAALNRRFELSGWAAFGLCTGVLIITCAVWWGALIAWSRRTSKRKDTESL